MPSADTSTVTFGVLLPTVAVAGPVTFTFGVAFWTVMEVDVVAPLVTPSVAS